jgi:peroxiredoxin Q/BCP
VQVVGVSGNDAETQALFKKEKDLPFTLLADPDGTVAKAFGVPTSPGREIPATVGGKQIKTKLGVVARRWTFVIDRDGKVIHKNTAAKPVDDARDVLAVLDKAGK